MAFTEGTDAIPTRSQVPMLNASNIWTGSPNVFEQGVYVGPGVGNAVGMRRTPVANNYQLQLVNTLTNNPTPFIEFVPSDAAQTPFRFDLATRLLKINADRYGRNSSFSMDSKASASSAGTEWKWYADADTSVVGKNMLALYGYPRDAAGNLIQSEVFLEFDFTGQGDTAGYQKRAWIHTRRVNADGFFMGTHVDATAMGGGTLVAFADNDNHWWESTGNGTWRFANRWGIASAGFDFWGGTAAEKRLMILDDMGKTSAAGETALGVLHAGIMKRVYVGDANTGGQGFRLLRIAN